MERVGTLINKLKEQFEQQAGAEKLAVTAQLILVELQKNHRQSSTGSKVSVVLPSVSGTLFPRENEPPTPKTAESVKEEPEEKKSDAGEWSYNESGDIPTLTHQDQLPVKAPVEMAEFNKALASQVESMNEKLKEDRIEVVNTLQGTPVRDLKKAIGLNDRYLFVHDLFRGDENMYERSIKTINGFTIYPEAQYWIQRELKVKLSWPDNSDTVKLFDQLVKRRFS